LYYYFFFFQAEDGIRDLIVTGVQTCALPICHTGKGITAVGNGTLTITATGGASSIDVSSTALDLTGQILGAGTIATVNSSGGVKIGRASCRERVEISVGGVELIKEEREATSE